MINIPLSAVTGNTNKPDTPLTSLALQIREEMQINQIHCEEWKMMARYTNYYN